MLLRDGGDDAGDRRPEADAVDRGEEIRGLQRGSVERDLCRLLQERDGGGVDSREGAASDFFFFFFSGEVSFFLILSFLETQQIKANKNLPESLFDGRRARRAVHPLDRELAGGFAE